MKEIRKRGQNRGEVSEDFMEIELQVKLKAEREGESVRFVFSHF